MTYDANDNAAKSYAVAIDAMRARSNASDLRAPFPWFGGKSAIADVVWKRFGSQNDDDDGLGRANSKRERLWFSPHCMKPDRSISLLDLMGAAE